MEEEFFNQRVIVKAQRGQCSRCSLADAAASIRQLLDDAVRHKHDMRESCLLLTCEIAEGGDESFVCQHG
jgi:hypothetical protein